MRNTSWIRVVLCGIVAGVVWNLLLLAVFARDFAATVQKAGPYTRWGGGAFFAIDLLMGIWSVWLYSAISPRYYDRTEGTA